MIEGNQRNAVHLIISKFFVKKELIVCFLVHIIYKSANCRAHFGRKKVVPIFFAKKEHKTGFYIFLG